MIKLLQLILYNHALAGRFVTAYEVERRRRRDVQLLPERSPQRELPR